MLVCKFVCLDVQKEMVILSALFMLDVNHFDQGQAKTLFPRPPSPRVFWPWGGVLGIEVFVFVAYRV